MRAREPHDEPARLHALRELAILDTPPEEAFDRLTRLACCALAVPTALVSLVDAERQWFKSRQGVDVLETPREIAFCAHAILSDALLVVADAAQDPRFEDNPLVCAAPGFRFYAGRPLHAPDGHRVGTFCVLDTVPRALGADQLQTLEDLAVMAEEQLAARTVAGLLVQKEIAVRRFQTLASSLPIGVFETDARGGCTYTNENWRAVTGLSPEQALGDGWSLAIHEDDRDEVSAAWLQAARSATLFERSFRFRRDDGEVRWVQVRARPVCAPDGALVSWLGVSQDITDDRQLRQALEESEERFRQMAEASDAVFWITDVQTHDVLYVSPAYERIWQRPAASLLAQPWDWIEAIHPEDRARAQAAFQEVLDGASQFEVEFRIQRPDGSVRYVLDRGFPVRDAQGTIIRMAGFAADITELQAAQAELKRQAEIDWLTGAVNTGKLRGLLSHELARTKRHQVHLAVAVIDVDSFKEVNDRHGHAAGDAALRWIAACFRARLRAADVLGRLGGDEFCVLLPECTAQAAAGVVREIAEEIARTPVQLESGVSFTVTLSAGVSATHSGEATDDELLRTADEALYEAKHRGRNRVLCARG